MILPSRPAQNLKQWFKSACDVSHSVAIVYTVAYELFSMPVAEFA